MYIGHSHNNVQLCIMFDHADEIWSFTDVLQNFRWRLHLHRTGSGQFGFIGWKSHKQ